MIPKRQPPKEEKNATFHFQPCASNPTCRNISRTIPGQSGTHCPGQFPSRMQHVGTFPGQSRDRPGHTVPVSFLRGSNMLEHFRDNPGTDRDTLSRSVSFVDSTSRNISGTIPGQSGTHCPGQFPSWIQHLGTLTPFGLYNINNGGGGDGMGSGRHLRPALYAISSPKRCLSVWQCKLRGPIKPRREAPRWRTTGAKPKFKSCVFFFLRGPPLSFGRMSSLETMTKNDTDSTSQVLHIKAHAPNQLPSTRSSNKCGRFFGAYHAAGKKTYNNWLRTLLAKCVWTQ